VNRAKSGSERAFLPAATRPSPSLPEDSSTADLPRCGTFRVMNAVNDRDLAFRFKSTSVRSLFLSRFFSSFLLFFFFLLSSGYHPVLVQFSFFFRDTRERERGKSNARRLERDSPRSIFFRDESNAVTSLRQSRIARSRSLFPLLPILLPLSGFPFRDFGTTLGNRHRAYARAPSRPTRRNAMTSRACRVTERAQIVALELDSPTISLRDSGSINLIGLIAPPLAPTRVTRYIMPSLFRLII